MNDVLPKRDFYQQVIDLIMNPHFQFIRRSFMNSWSDIETLFLFIKTAEFICDEYERRYHHPITPDQLKSALKHVFEDRNLRLRAIEMFRDYQSGAQDNKRIASHGGGIMKLPSFVFLPAMLKTD